MTLAIILLIAVFITADWYYYYRTKRSLDIEFGRRLEGLAELASAHLGPDTLSLFRSSWAESERGDDLTARLEKLREENSLYNISIVGADGTIRFTLESGIYAVEEEYPYYGTDYAAIARALAGQAAATELYSAPDGTYLKAGYAPVPFNAAKASAFVAVEANPVFLEGLDKLKLILLAVTAASVLGIVLFAAFAFKATGSLIRARESLMHAETLATMGHMAAGIAHEIRNPLFIIRSSAEKLRDIYPERREEIESYLIEEVDRLNCILTDYLLFAKDEPTRKAPFDLLKTLTRSLKSVRESIEGGRIELIGDFETAEAPFFGEEKRLQQSFLNILLNARQAITGNGTMTVTFSVTGGRYMIRFADTGIGISKRDIGKIFEPFFTTKTNGSGLGLAITKKVVEDHRGAIEVKSKPGTGTEVVVTFPIPRETREKKAGLVDTSGDKPQRGD